MKIELLDSLGAFSVPLKRYISTVAVDSRLVEPGAIFFALPGEKTDGHQFLSEVISKGASGAIIREDFQGNIPDQFPVMRVKDPLQTLQMFAQRSVAANRSKVCAITGSVGKTTTKEFVVSIASQEKKIASTIKSHNSQIGLSLSLLNEMKGDEEWIVAEMGMSHAGELTTLTSIAPPDVAVVTNVSLVHAANFPSFQAIAQAKAEIFGKTKTRTCLFNADTNYVDVLSQAALGRGKSFSMKYGDSFWSMRVLEDTLLVQEDGSEKKFKKPLFPAPHVYDNLLAAIATARAMGISWEAIESALPLLHLPSQRIEHTVIRGIHFINDSFNACEPSMLAALDVLKKTPGTRKVAVLGAMKELGSFSPECHKKVGEKAREIADALYFLGQEWLPVIQVWNDKVNNFILASTLQELIDRLEKDLKEGDVVLLKGSRWANQLWKVVEHFHN